MKQMPSSLNQPTPTSNSISDTFTTSPGFSTVYSVKNAVFLAKCKHMGLELLSKFFSAIASSSNAMKSLPYSTPSIKLQSPSTPTSTTKPNLQDQPTATDENNQSPANAVGVEYGLEFGVTVGCCCWFCYGWYWTTIQKVRWRNHSRMCSRKMLSWTDDKILKYVEILWLMRIGRAIFSFEIE